ncbi:MAG TPA: hypothetical protein VK875_05910, partial [Euzebyales bacterium]|nr:hypothetical protein [Euzebyales bacterium]
MRVVSEPVTTGDGDAEIVADERMPAQPVAVVLGRARIVDYGVVSRPRARDRRCVALELVGGGVANGYFLVHAPRPPIEAADQRVLNRRSFAGIGEAA